MLYLTIVGNCRYFLDGDSLVRVAYGIRARSNPREEIRFLSTAARENAKLTKAHPQRLLYRILAWQQRRAVRKIMAEFNLWPAKPRRWPMRATR
ncbi:MAG: hypothetical protein K2R98_15210 [Gemmataceae bacterium]|nr:hypothetical protein [Gemmataceae bacterium]